MGHCAYCGKWDIVDRDHIPPKSLFGDNPPPNLITVPACKECHHGKNENISLDDQYFVHRLIMKEDTEWHPVVQYEMLPKLFRGWTRNESFSYFLSTLADERNLAWDGYRFVAVNGKPKIYIDGSRFQRVLMRILKGLFFYIKKVPIPESHGLWINLTSLIVDQNYVRHFVAPMFTNLSWNTKGNIFAYKVIWDPQDPYKSNWLISFYETVFAFGQIRTKPLPEMMAVPFVEDSQAIRLLQFI